MDKISQSFISTMRDYIAGEECGNIVKHQYVDGNLIDWESDAMDAGMYFEYLLTKAVPKDGLVPQPVYMKTPLEKKKKEDLKVVDMIAQYRQLHAYADQVRALFDEWGWEIIDIGKTFTLGRFVGTIDITVKCTKAITFRGGQWKLGDKLTIDVKLTGLLNNKWDKFGWVFELPLQRNYRRTQAIQYHMITKLPFYYLVISSTTKEEDGPDGKKLVPATDVRLFHVPVYPEMIDAHVAEANHLHEKFELEAKTGFVSRPEYFKCSSCPIREACKDKHTFPRPQVIDLA